MTVSSSTILILAPHTDDGELGCGASIAKYLRQGKQIHYVAFSTCEQSLPAGFEAGTLAEECKKATSALGINHVNLFDFEVRKFPALRQEILEEMVVLNNSIKPELVLVPAKNDVHQDHQVIFREASRAFKNCSLLGYELPWNNTSFSPAYFEAISDADLSLKIAALKEYKTQEHRNYMKEDFIRSLATVRGVQSGTALAEAFEVYKLVNQK